MRAKEIQTGVRIRSPVYMRSRFQNLALKEEKKKKEKPSNANADAGAIRFTDVHKYT
jgi:hypothetical protein